MPRLTAVDPATASGEAKELLDAVEQKLGMAPNIVRTMANSPAVLKAFLGFGEALSGGERECELDRIYSRLDRDGIPRAKFARYLEEVEKGVPRSAGFGIGIERLTRFICGLDSIEDARLFPKSPGRTDSI